jgi:hypothetical protein
MGNIDGNTISGPPCFGVPEDGMAFEPSFYFLGGGIVGKVVVFADNGALANPFYGYVVIELVVIDCMDKLDAEDHVFVHLGQHVP